MVYTVDVPILEKLVVRGYKSIREADLRLNRINVLIGANGSGKSNLIDLLRFMRRLAEGKLQITVAQAGGANRLLWYGKKATDRMHVELWFRTSANHLNGYECNLIPTDDDRLVFESESVYFHDTARHSRPYHEWLGTGGHRESRLTEEALEGVRQHVYWAMRSWRVYHFHDTSPSAKVKQTGDIHDNEVLHEDAGNLAAYLYLLREKYRDYYNLIIDTIRRVAPFFDDFVLRPSEMNAENIRLEWREQGKDNIFSASALSDGTLRFMCLATLLLQPPERMPQTIVCDEPELGLHPSAIALLASMMKSASVHNQIVVATQSVTFVNHFCPEDVVVVEREGDTSVFHRLEAEQIAGWLEEYSLGEVWEKNLVGGRP